MGSNHLHRVMRKNIPTHDPQTGELNPHYEELTGEKNPMELDRWTDWNTLEMDKLVKYLEDKYMYHSSGDAFAINKLIEFYRENSKK